MGLLGRIFGRAERRENAEAVKGAEPPKMAGCEPEPAAVSGPAPALSVAPRPPVPSREDHEDSDGYAPVKRVTISENGLSLLDLRVLGSSRFRIVGSAYWVSDAERGRFGGNRYVLVREPGNKWDENAVGVFGKGRKVGHLSAAKAAAFAPILDALPYDAFVVAGAGVGNSSRLWIDLPSIPVLRKFAKVQATP